METSRTGWAGVRAAVAALTVCVLLGAPGCKRSGVASPSDGATAAADGGRADGPGGGGDGPLLDDGGASEVSLADGPFEVSADETDGGSIPNQLALARETLPHDDAGQPILIEGEGVRLVLGPVIRDAIYTQATCTEGLNRCLRGAGGSFSSCVARAPVCATDQPWNEAGACCPKACLDAYAAGIAAGGAPLATWLSIWATPHACFPGLSKLLEAAR